MFSRCLSALLVGLVVLFASSCKESGKSKASQATNNVVALPQIDFSADSAFAFTAAQVAFGPRVPGSKAHGQCVDFLVAKMSQFGAKVSLQEGTGSAYDGTPEPVRNIICQYAPENPKRLLLCAHYDSRPFADHDANEALRNSPIDGANDGASAVAVLMEVGRQFSLKAPAVGVDIIFFDAEDGGTPDHIQADYRPDTWCVGSQMWGMSDWGYNARHRFGILLDMIGGENIYFPVELYSKSQAPDVVNKVWSVAERLGYGAIFSRQDGGHITDDHYYVNRATGIPVVDIIHFDNNGFAPYWHTHNDVLENVSRKSLDVVGRVVMSVVMMEK